MMWNLGGGAMANREPSLKRLQQRLRLAFATYTDLGERRGHQGVVRLGL